MADPTSATQAIVRLLGIMDKLRDPGGCPWDREQTLQTLTPYLLEEAHEVIEAIESGDAEHHREELGDLLFQVVFQARIARETGKFDFASVCDAISDKLTRRHPHVFADATVSGSREVVKNWERIKSEERKEKGQAPRSAIGGVPVALPALVRAERLTEKAAAVGFDWPDANAVLAKVREELAELEHEVAAASGASGNAASGASGNAASGASGNAASGASGNAASGASGNAASGASGNAASGASGNGATNHARIGEELGDLLFAIANLARFVKVHPEEALRGTLRRFESRFHHIESRLAGQARTPRESTLEEMDQLWNEAKALEAAKSAG
jgi:MazG family protein